MTNTLLMSNCSQIHNRRRKMINSLFNIWARPPVRGMRVISERGQQGPFGQYMFNNLVNLVNWGDNWSNADNWWDGNYFGRLDNLCGNYFKRRDNLCGRTTMLNGAIRFNNSVCVTDAEGIGELWCHRHGVMVWFVSDFNLTLQCFVLE